MSFLALDIGNSSVKAAVWDGEWSAVSRWSSGLPPGTTRLPASAAVWRGRLALLPTAARVGIASVVPRLTETLERAARDTTGTEPVRVSADLPLPFRMGYRTPGTLGADRLAAAVAAHTLAGGRAVVAVDAGTAVTLEAVTARSPDGPAYLGGAILPGPDLLMRTLARDTGQLPDVPWAVPASPVGGSTAEAIQTGLAVLLADGVAGLVRRTVEAVGGDALVVATGGWAPWLAEHVHIDRVVPTLVLDGIRQLCDH